MRKLLLSLVLSLVLTGGYGHGATPPANKPMVKPASVPAEVRIDLPYPHPSYAIAQVLKNNPETQKFRMSYYVRLNIFFMGADALYDRRKQTLKYSFRDNNIGIRENYLYPHITDKTLCRLGKIMESAERRRHIVCSAEDLPRYLAQMGCKRIKLPGTNYP